VADGDWQVQVGATARGLRIGTVLDIYDTAVDYVREQDVPRSPAGEEVSHGAGLVPYHEPSLDRLLEELDPVRLGHRSDLADQQVARRGDGRIADATLAHKCFWKAPLGQVTEHRDGEPVGVKLRHAVQHVGGRRLLMLRPRQMMFCRKRPQGCRMIGVIEQGLGCSP
jgi:hypothetical protein